MRIHFTAWISYHVALLEDQRMAPIFSFFGKKCSPQGLRRLVFLLPPHIHEGLATRSLTSLQDRRLLKGMVAPHHKTSFPFFGSFEALGAPFPSFWKTPPLQNLSLLSLFLSELIIDGSYRPPFPRPRGRALFFVQSHCRGARADHLVP